MGAGAACPRYRIAGRSKEYQPQVSADTAPNWPQEHDRADSLTPVSQGLGRVLVVDDDEVIRQLIAVNLTLEGFEVVTAVDGRECLEKVTEVHPDVITLDVMMPRLDGWVTATQLRRNPETAGIKVVLITARAQEDDRDRGRQIGVDAYLTKPFDPAEMIRVVRELAGASSTAFD
jgi:CheY-like chemotaxis protein